MSRLKPIAVLLCAAAMTSCDIYDGTAVQKIAGPAPSARVKFFNFGVGSPGVNFYANETKMTAISSTNGNESTNGVNYGNAGSGGLYMGVEPGQYTFTGRIAAATDKDLAISTVATTIENGRFYSFYQSGIYDGTAKTVDAFVVEDVMPAGAIDYSVAHVRFVNAISNGTGDLNLYATNTTNLTETAIGGAVAYKAAGTFTAVPAGVYNLRTAYTGATSNLISRTGLSFEGGRVYTITSRGNTATASTMALDFTQNQR